MYIKVFWVGVGRYRYFGYGKVFMLVFRYECVVVMVEVG